MFCFVLELYYKTSHRAISKADVMIPKAKIDQAKNTDILALIPTDLRRVSGHNGGEYAGPCPWCGGDDRFRVWPKTGRYWCRQCERKGDQVDLIRDLQGVTFTDAVDRLAGGMTVEKSTEQQTEPETDYTLWDDRSRAFLDYTQKNLKPGGIDYLATRGIDQLTAWGVGLGWNPEPITDRGDRWGLDSCIYLGAGLVIPHEHKGRITAINIRTANGYRIVKGSRLVRDGQRVIYKPLPWPVKGKLILFEGELDAIAAWQTISDPTIGIGAIPAGNLTSLDQLQDHEIYVCFDTDQAGKEASAKAAELGAQVITLPDQYKDYSEFLLAVGDSQARGYLYTEVTHHGRK